MEASYPDHAVPSSSLMTILNHEGVRRIYQLKEQTSQAVEDLSTEERESFYSLSEREQVFSEAQLQFLKVRCSPEIYTSAVELMAINWMLQALH
jgi:hypothetical protein